MFWSILCDRARCRPLGTGGGHWALEAVTGQLWRSLDTGGGHWALVAATGQWWRTQWPAPWRVRSAVSPSNTGAARYAGGPPHRPAPLATGLSPDYRHTVPASVSKISCLSWLSGLWRRLIPAARM